VQPYWSQQYWNAFGQLMVFGMFMAMAGGLMAGFIRESPSSGEHHSSWLTPEQRKTLVEKYGTMRSTGKPSGSRAKARTEREVSDAGTGNSDHKG